MKTLKVKQEGNTLIIGEKPELIVNLITQQNYIKDEHEMIPYAREVAFSPDLLDGKRENVFQTAVNHYYTKACEVYEGMKIAGAYREKMNITIREK